MPAYKAWFREVDPRIEVKRGRSFNPDEFAIALEQVVAGTAPEDYRDPEKFFARTCFTRALREYAGMILARLAGRTENTTPLLGLVTQFGGGKTHTLTSLYHMIRHPRKAEEEEGVKKILKEIRLPHVPEARVAVFVGNAWDPQPGRETPWIDLARQVGGAEGVAFLGDAAKTVPPGTEALGRLFGAKPTLVLFDEVLNFVNRHRAMADAFYAFCQNISVAMTGTASSVAVMSLPRSQVEMTEADLEWQDRLLKVFRRVLKELIANDEVEISEIIRRRLFESLGPERVRKAVAKDYTDWCFEHRNHLPREWTSIDAAATEAKARDFLRAKFESCYPFHPATISVFQRKWQTLQHYQQTRGTLAMLAQWISWVYREGAQGEARSEPLITLGSAPLHVRGFRSVILGQLGEPRLEPAIEVDIAGERSHARALDSDVSGPLSRIHQRVASAILFESSGGQVSEKAAYLADLFFALGEPKLDVASIERAAADIEKRAFYIRKVGKEGYCFGFKPKLTKVATERRASLDDDEVRKAMAALVEAEFKRGAAVPVMLVRDDPTTIPDSPKLMLAVVDPEQEWGGAGLRQRLVDWTRVRGTGPRMYPASVIWCIRKPGRDLRNKVELWLAWKRVEQDEKTGLFGSDFDKQERAGIASQVRDAEDAARDEVWASYRYVFLLDRQMKEGFREIDLGSGHMSQGGTLCGLVISALKNEAYIGTGVGVGYLERNWPEALKESGRWPLSGIRQCFLDGTFHRLLDPDTVLRAQIQDLVQRGEFGLQSGDRLWFNEPVSAEEISFQGDVCLVLRKRAEALKKGEAAPPQPAEPPPPEKEKPVEKPVETVPGGSRTIRIHGEISREVWNRLGNNLLFKLKPARGLRIGISFEAEIEEADADRVIAELRQALEDLHIADKVRID